ncbi:MAG: proline racemase family protein [Desulfurococcaceae archaeon]
MRVLNTIEVHNAGMPVRIVFMPNIPGANMREKKNYCKQNLEWVRKLITFEPRGSSNSYGILITDPSNRNAHFGALFMSPSGWHDMCGHSSMAFACYAARTGLVNLVDDKPLILDTPAGLVDLYVERHQPGRVRMVNVPSYIVETRRFQLNEYGSVEVYLSYGGNLCGVIDLDVIGMNWDIDSLPQMLSFIRDIWKRLLREPVRAKYLSDVELHGIRLSKRISKSPPRYYGILIYGSPDRPLLDRSPSGTGSSAHIAYLHYIGEVKMGEYVEFLSAINTAFGCRIIGETSINGLKAVIPEISSKDKACYITGFSTLIVEPDDPIKEGFPPLII